jgi:hypothetical protein
MKPLRYCLTGLAFFCLMTPARAQDHCFLQDFEPKLAVMPPFEEHAWPVSEATVTVQVNVEDTIGKVPKYLYGNNANVYMSQMVTEPVLLDHIRKLSPNIIRYPGGNLSSIFFWNASKNQPPADAPSTLLDGDGNPYTVGYWYGKNTEGWTLCVDNYYRMLDSTNSTGMITINYGYARYGTGPTPAQTAAGHAADWVRYDNGRTKFWEIGNESAGPWQAGFRIDTSQNQDGQPEIISGELYGEHFLIFRDSMRAAAAETGSEIYIGAQMIQYDATNSWNPPDRDWNEGFFREAGNAADFFIVHTYYTPYNENSVASVILNSATSETASMINWLRTSTGRAGTEMKPLALTEWNIFAIGSKQSCSFVSGMHAALVLGELARNQYGMSGRWDLANGYDNGDDHGMFNQGDEPGVPRWNPRPAFFYMYYFQHFFGDHIVNSSTSGSWDILSFASRFASGELGMVVVNKNTMAETVKLVMPEFGYGDRYYLYSLTGGTDNGEFSQVVNVNGHGADNAAGGPISNLDSIRAWSHVIDHSIVFESPGRSVQYILVENGDKTFTGGHMAAHEGPLKIFPNPSGGEFICELPSGAINIEVTDLRGKMIFTADLKGKGRTFRFALDQAPGLFIARVYSGRGVFINRLVIQ